MSRRHRDRSPLGQGAARQRRNRHATRRASAPAQQTAAFEQPTENPLIRMLRPALRSEVPTDFWVLTAPLVRELTELECSAPQQLPEDVDLLDTFLEVNVAETTALLHMVAAMSPDEELRSRARVGLTSRRQPMPTHVTGLVDATVTEVLEMGDLDGENLMLELTLPRGVRAVVVAYVPLDPAPYVQDTFVVAEPLSDVTEKYAEIMAREGFELADVLAPVGLADARARLDQALANTPPAADQDQVDGSQWPMVRSFLEHVVTLLPTGGTGYEAHEQHGDVPGRALPGSAPSPSSSERPPWVLEDGTDAVEDFAASTHTAQLEGDPGAVKDLIAFMMLVLAQATGDALDWDGEAAEWLLTDLLPSSPMISQAQAEQVPTVVPAFIAWVLERTGTERTGIERELARAAPLLARFPDLYADPRMLAARLEGHVDLALEFEDPVGLRAAELVLSVGGTEALETLDATPLPAEELALARIPADLQEFAAEIDGHLVTGVRALLAQHPGAAEADEMLTACRRLLVRIAELDASVLRRKASTLNTAGALASIIARGNELMGYSPAPLSEKHLVAAFGLRSAPGQRARTLAQAAALPYRLNGLALGDPALLLGTARAKLLRQRDEFETR